MAKHSGTVVNMVGTSNDKPTCGCGTWTNHWRRNTGSERKTCMALGCDEDVEHGAHVKDDRKEMIVGLCAKHNVGTKGAFEIDRRTDGVPIGKQAACGTANRIGIRKDVLDAFIDEVMKKSGS